jgi:hypothetical protein
MAISARTQTLLDRLPKDHPLTPAMEAAMVAAAAASEGFAGHKIALASDKRMTPLGQRQALQAALTGNHGKQWARANASVLRERKKITARRDALVVQAVDPANLAAALERQEIRAWFRSLDLGVRQSIALASKDRRILEALCSAPPELSGIAGPKAAAEIEDRYLELTYGDELSAIAAADAVVAEAEASMHIQRNELRSVLAVAEVESTDKEGVTRRELVSVANNPRAFDELMRPLETIRPWITKDGLQVCEPLPNGKASYRAATEADLAFGVQYENLAAWQAAQGMDVAA